MQFRDCTHVYLYAANWRLKYHIYTCYLYIHSRLSTNPEYDITQGILFCKNYR